MPDKNPSAISGFYDGIFHYYDAANSFLTLGLDARWRRAAAWPWPRDPNAPGHLLRDRRLSGNFTGFRSGTRSLPAWISTRPCSRWPAKKPRHPVHRTGALPFPDGAFDALTVAFAARNLNYGGKGLLKYFREFHRVLGPGGTFVNIETSRPGSHFIRSLFHAFVRLMTAVLVRFLPTEHRAAYGFLAGTIAVFHSPEELSKILLAAGFSKVETARRMFGAIAIHRAIKQ